MPARPLLIFVLGLILAGPAIGGDEPAPDAPPASESPRDPGSARTDRRQMSAALVPQLGNPRYAVREEATRKLSQMGSDAIESLLVAARSENLEVISRAVRALGTIYEAEDDATFDAAELALEQLAESSNRSAAQRALAILSPPEPAWPPDTDRRRFRRWKRAIERIRELGDLSRSWTRGAVSCGTSPSLRQRNIRN
jgi:hypothetical protein